MTTEADDASGAAVRILRGTASAEETAAVVVALSALGTTRASREPAARAPAWTAAARLEGVGARLVTSRAALVAP